MHTIKFVLFTAIACCSVPAIAQWQWIDAHGRKVFSDRAPPAEIPAKNILQSPGVAKPIGTADDVSAGSTPLTTSAKTVTNPGVDKGLEEQKRKMEEQDAAKEQVDRARQERVRKENCTRAQQTKATLASGRMLAHVNANGERGFMDENAREAEVKRAETVIAADCGPLPEASSQ